MRIPYRTTGSESVSVALSIRGAGSSAPLLGGALIEDDAATAAVRATLQALNRKLS